MQFRHFLAAAASVAMVAPALAAQQPAAPQPTEQQPAAEAPTVQQSGRGFTPAFGFSVGGMSIEPGAAAQSEIGARSYGLQLDAGVLLKRHFYLGADIGGQFLDDHAQFTQNTTGGEMKSTASVTYLSALAGVRTGVLRAVPVALALNAGASATMSRRSIDNCSDCDVDKLDIPGGAFVEPVLMFGRGTMRLRVSDRVYLGGEGMLNVISIGADLQPRRR